VLDEQADDHRDSACQRRPYTHRQNPSKVFQSTERATCTYQAPTAGKTKDLRNVRSPDCSNGWTAGASFWMSREQAEGARDMTGRHHNAARIHHESRSDYVRNTVVGPNLNLAGTASDASATTLRHTMSAVSVSSTKKLLHAHEWDAARQVPNNRRSLRDVLWQLSDSPSDISFPDAR
jgi:hypothetical protein